jgi:hypothetical protein
MPTNIQKPGAGVSSGNADAQAAVEQGRSDLLTDAQVSRVAAILDSMARTIGEPRPDTDGTCWRGGEEA